MLRAPNANYAVAQQCLPVSDWKLAFASTANCSIACKEGTLNEIINQNSASLCLDVYLLTAVQLFMLR